MSSLQPAAKLRGAVPHSESTTDPSGQIKAISGWASISSYDGDTEALSVTCPIESTGTTEQLFELSKLSGSFDTTKIQHLNVSIRERPAIGGKTQGTPAWAHVGPDIDGGDFRVVNLGGWLLDISGDGLDGDTTYEQIIPIFPGDTAVKIFVSQLSNTKNDWTTVTLKDVWTISTSMSVPEVTTRYLSGSRTYLNRTSQDGYVDGTTEKFSYGSEQYPIVSTWTETEDDDWSNILPLSIAKTVKRTVVRAAIALNAGGNDSEELLTYVLDLNWTSQTGSILLQSNHELRSEWNHLIKFNVDDGFDHVSQWNGMNIRLVGEFSSRQIIKLPWYTSESYNLAQGTFEIQHFEDAVVLIPTAGAWFDQQDLGDLSGDVSSVFVPGYVYTANVASDITSWDIEIPYEGEVVVHLTNSSTYAVAEPAGFLKRSEAGLDQLGGSLVELHFTRSGVRKVVSAVELVPTV